MNEFSAVLLAGGESRRFGSDKALFLFDEMPLWRRQISLLQALRPREVFVAARSDPPWHPEDVTFVPDEPPSRGPLSGMAATLQRMKSPFLLVLAVDMPGMEAWYLEALLSRVQPDCGVVPFRGRTAEPLAAIYPASAALEFEQALRGSDFALQPLVTRLVSCGKLQALDVEQKDERLFSNLNESCDRPGLDR